MTIDVYCRSRAGDGKFFAHCVSDDGRECHLCTSAPYSRFFRKIVRRAFGVELSSVEIHIM